MKKQKHRWESGRLKVTHCILCGCRKERGVYSIRYITRNGKVSQIAPECNPDTLYTVGDTIK